MYASVSNVHSSMTNCEVVAHISPPISTENHKLQLPNVHLQVIDINPTSYCMPPSQYKLTSEESLLQQQ